MIFYHSQMWWLLGRSRWHHGNCKICSGRDNGGISVKQMGPSAHIQGTYQGNPLLELIDFMNLLSFIYRLWKTNTLFTIYPFTWLRQHVQDLWDLLILDNAGSGQTIKYHKLMVYNKNYNYFFGGVFDSLIQQEPWITLPVLDPNKHCCS